MDQTRLIDAGDGRLSGEAALDAVADQFVLDRRPHMKRDVLIVSEKAGIIPLIHAQFAWTDATSLNGYASQTLKGRIKAECYDLILSLVISIPPVWTSNVI